MPHFAAFHLGLHCLPKYPSTLLGVSSGSSVCSSTSLGVYNIQKVKVYFLGNYKLTPGYIQWTIIILFCQTRRKNPLIQKGKWELSCRVLDSRPRATGSSHSGITALWSLSKTHLSWHFISLEYYWNLINSLCGNSELNFFFFSASICIFASICCCLSPGFQITLSLLAVTFIVCW